MYTKGWKQFTKSEPLTAGVNCPVKPELVCVGLGGSGNLRGGGGSVRNCLVNQSLWVGMLDKG